MIGYLKAKIFGINKNYYNDDKWSIINGVNNDWKKANGKVKNTDIRELIITYNPYDKLSI